jgi:hypothetical protein
MFETIQCKVCGEYAEVQSLSEQYHMRLCYDCLDEQEETKMEYGLFLYGELVTGGYYNPMDAYKGAIFAYEETGLFHEVKVIENV